MYDGPLGYAIYCDDVGLERLKEDIRKANDGDWIRIEETRK
jgi:hypothetical protein